MGYSDEFGSRKKRIWKAECGSRKKAKPMEIADRLTKNQLFKRYALYPMPYALLVQIPISDLCLLSSVF
jgi:hypothetical protein